MKGIKLLLALTTLAGMAQAADPTYTWWKGEDTMNVSASTSGTWTIGMNINVEALKSFGAGGSRQQPTNGNYSNTGNVLFMATGDGYYEGGTGAFLFDSVERREYNDRDMYLTMGWGGNWYVNVPQADNAVPEGLQLGVTSTGNPNNLTGGGLGSGIGSIFSNDKGFEVYVADMKRQNGENGGVHNGTNGSYDWSIDELAKATAVTLDCIAEMSDIEKATLFVVHTFAGVTAGQLSESPHCDYASNDGNYKTDVTYTTFYLTVIGKDETGNDVTYNFMGQNDDTSSNAGSMGAEGKLLGGSCWYDVDFVEEISKINKDFIEDTDFVFVNSALTSAQREALMSNGLPEPTTATMSLLALAALAARRRRRAVASK